jgi:hypothetical protein
VVGCGGGKNLWRGYEGRDYILEHERRPRCEWVAGHAFIVLRVLFIANSVISG